MLVIKNLSRLFRQLHLLPSIFLMSYSTSQTNTSASNNQSENKFRELDLSVIEDLEIFLESAEYVLEETKQFLAVAEVEHYRSLNADGINGKEIFRVLSEKLDFIKMLVAEFRNVYIANDREIPDAKVEIIQTTYNDLRTLRDYVTETYLNHRTPKRVEVAPAPPQVEEVEEDDEDAHDEELPTVFVSRKTMNIVNDDDGADLPLYVARETEEVIGEEAVLTTTRNLAVEAELNHEENTVVAETETKDPINQVIPNRQQPVKPKDIVNSANSIWDKLSRHKRYQSFISTHYPTRESFDKFLNNKVIQIENRTTDSFERWLGEKHVSAFHYLKNKTIDEISELMARRDLRSVLMRHNVKYETFLTWIDLITEIQGLMASNENSTLEELFARGLIESQMQKPNQNI
jgi:hypothetical protein